MRCGPFRLMQAFLSYLSVSLLLLLTIPQVWAVDPDCNTSWAKTNTTWTCTGNGQISFRPNTSFLPNRSLTLIASDGFILESNVVGSADRQVNLQADYGAIQVRGNNNALTGNITANSSHLTLAALRLTGNISTSGDIRITAGQVVGNLTSQSNSITLVDSTLFGTLWAHTNVTLTAVQSQGFITSNTGTISSSNSQLNGFLTALSGIQLNGGSVSGDLEVTANTPIILSGVTMSRGRIIGGSTVTLTASQVGSASNTVNIQTNSGHIILNNNSVLYGNATAVVGQEWGRVQIANGSFVYGTCYRQAEPPEACQPNPPPSVHHYELSFQSPAVTCEAEMVTVRACSNANCSSTFQGQSTVTLTANNGGDWSTSTIQLQQGVGSALLRKTTPGNTSIGISTASVTASSAVVCKNGGQNAACTLQFADSALKFVATDATSAWPNQIAGTSYSGRLRAIQTNPETGACQARVQGARAVGLAFRCLNPSSCQATQRGWFQSTALAGSGQTPSYQPVTLTFDEQGIAPLNFFYTDVGQIALHAQLVLAASGGQPAITLTAAAAPVVVKPDRIVVHAVQRADGTANPQTSHSGQGFVAADAWFRVQLEVRNSLNQVTPNFGRELQPEQLQLQFGQLSYPTAQPSVNYANLLVVNSAMTPVTGMPGRFEFSQVAFRDVGTIRLQATLMDGNYLGAGNVLSSPLSSPIGRFFPAYFALSEVQTAPTCVAGNFSYLSQPGLPLQFRVRAMSQGLSLGGGQTAPRQVVNYHQFNNNSASYQGTAVFGLVAQNRPPAPVRDLSARLSTVTMPLWQQGELRFNAGTSLQLQRASQPDGPWRAVQLGARIVTELDNRQFLPAQLTMNAALLSDCQSNNSCNAAPLGQPQVFYHGRLQLARAQGPVQQMIPLTLQAQYWDGERFTRLMADECTLTEPSQLRLPWDLAQAASGNSQSMWQGQSRSQSIWLPPYPQTGQWLMRYTTPEWLQHAGMDAQAELVIGGFRGNDRLIYQREQ